MKKPTEIIFHPGRPMSVAVPHYAVGVLSKRYPAKPGEKKFASQDALKKYGHDLFITVANIYKEVLDTQHAAHVQVTWNTDGSPELKVIKRNLILVPGGFVPGVN